MSGALMKPSGLPVGSLVCWQLLKHLMKTHVNFGIIGNFLELLDDGNEMF